MKHRIKIVIPFVLVLLFIPQFIPAQSNEVIDRLIEQEQATFEDAFYMVKTAVGEKADVLSSFDSNGTITLGEYSYLLMEAFDLPSGIMYRLFPGPRYATREIAYQGFIRGSNMPGRPITGREVINILRRVMVWKEESA